MKEAVFNISVEESIELLKSINLFKSSRISKDIGLYSEESIEVSRSNDYLKIYEAIINNRDYDIQLIDDSIFQLSNKGGKCRYAFMQCTHETLTFEEFFYEVFGSDYDASEGPIQTFYADFENEYNQCRDEQKINTDAVYFRYDVDQQGYIPNVHSYAHLHVGLNNSIRIPCSRELTPLAFVLFTVKHVYSSYWKQAVIMEQIKEKHYLFKQKCSPISDNYWKDIEKRDLYID